jgi:hypothetical protein
MSGPDTTYNLSRTDRIPGYTPPPTAEDLTAVYPGESKSKYGDIENYDPQDGSPWNMGKRDILEDHGAVVDKSTKQLLWHHGGIWLGLSIFTAIFKTIHDQVSGYTPNRISINIKPEDAPKPPSLRKVLLRNWGHWHNLCAAAGIYVFFNLLIGLTKGKK